MANGFWKEEYTHSIIHMINNHNDERLGIKSPTSRRDPFVYYSNISIKWSHMVRWSIYIVRMAKSLFITTFAQRFMRMLSQPQFIRSLNNTNPCCVLLLLMTFQFSVKLRVFNQEKEKEREIWRHIVTSVTFNQNH